MADQKISELTPVVSLAGTEPLAVVQSGTTKQATINQVSSFIASSVVDNFPNIFINGCATWWERTTSDAAVTTTRKYVADRWAFKTGAGTLTAVAQSTTVRTGGRSRYSIMLTGTAGVTTVDIDQRIGTIYSGQYKRSITLSTYIQNVTGAAFVPTLFASTPSVADDWTTNTVRNGGGSGESLQSCADAAWTQVSWTADVSGYTNIDNGLEIKIRIPSGSLVAGDTVRIAELSLVPGAGTTFVAQPPGLEQWLSRRYYQQMGYGMSGDAVTTTTVGVAGQFIPEMRAAPTLALMTATPSIRSNYTGTVVGAGSTLTNTQSGVKGFGATITGFTGLTVGEGATVITAAVISADAEL